MSERLDEETCYLCDPDNPDAAEEGCRACDREFWAWWADVVPECSHEWLDRPESDTHECLICGEEGCGPPPVSA